MDFLLMSYILYTYDLALPVIIAAGSMGAEGAAAPPKVDVCSPVEIKLA